MKHLTQEQLERLERQREKHERKRILRRLTRQDREKSRVTRILQSHEDLSENLLPQENRYSIELPSEISLTHNYESTIRFINELRNAVLVERLPVLLHFDNVQSVSPAAALIMTAEIFRCRNLRPGRSGIEPVNGNWPDDNKARKVLSDMGFYRLMKLPAMVHKEDDELNNTIHLGLASYNNVDAELIAEFHQSLLNKIDVDLSETESKRLQGGIIEAIGNATEHAYRVRPPYQFMNKRSWISGYIDIPKKELMFMVLDQGAGVPATLDPTLIERALSLGRFHGLQPRDSELIKNASELRRTSIGSSGRGKGIETMKRFIDTTGDGELNIYSNRGLYIHSSDGEDSTIDHDGTLGGTLVQWRVQKR